MSDPKDDGKLREFADSAVMMLVSRISVPMIVALCLWIAGSVSSMQRDVATAMATLAGHDKRIDMLETWRTSMDAVADEVVGRHR